MIEQELVEFSLGQPGRGANVALCWWKNLLDHYDDQKESGSVTSVCRADAGENKQNLSLSLLYYMNWITSAVGWLALRDSRNGELYYVPSGDINFSSISNSFAYN